MRRNTARNTAENPTADHGYEYEGSFDVEQGNTKTRGGNGTRPSAHGVRTAVAELPGRRRGLVTITAKLGPSREVYDLPNGGKHLMWPTQSLGEVTTAADIDASGKIVSVRQVLDENEFFKAQVGTWTRKDVLINFGRPVETSYFPLMKREVWTYRYMEANVWYMMYSFYFDDQGTLRLTQKTPDPLHDPDQRNFF